MSEPDLSYLKGLCGMTFYFLAGLCCLSTTSMDVSLWCQRLCTITKIYPFFNYFFKEEEEEAERDVSLVEFMYLVFTRIPGKSYRSRFRSLLLHLCDVFRALVNSLVCCFYT